MPVSGPARCPTAQPFHKAHQAHGRPFLDVVMGSAPPFVGRPVHEPWPGGKLPERVVRAVAQPHADLRARPVPARGAFPAGSRGPTGGCRRGPEHAPDDVQPDDPAPAVPALKPGPLAAKPARRPDGGDTLLAAPAVRRYAVGRASRGRAAGGSHPGASPARRCACNPRQATCRRPKGAPSAAP